MQRTKTILFLVTCLILILAGSAQATRWDGFEASVTCDGWQVDGAAKVGSANQPYVEIPYEISLSQDGMIVEEFVGSVRAYFQMDADVFSLSGTWATGLSGSYEVTGTFTLPFTTSGDSVMSFFETLECSTQQACDPHKPRWWVRHDDQWPVAELTIGGTIYSQNQLMASMRSCTRHRVSVRLLRHLVAAKLNVLSGCEDMVAGSIDAADAFFAENGLNPTLERSERRAARALKSELRLFNKGALSGDKTFVDDDDDSIVDFEHEQMNMSDIKEIFR